MLCKWGVFREHLEYTQLDEHQIVINQVAQETAKSMSSKEAERLWQSNVAGIDPWRTFLSNRNPLAIVLLSRSNAQYWQGKRTPHQKVISAGPTSSLISELPRQLDRKVCVTCGDRVNGVTYCSEQCRPSASIEWYLYHSTRAETRTVTEGFRTARSRFTSPSANSCATYDTSEFAPPPYGLIDANPPTPKFVPTKVKPREEGGTEKLTLYAGPEQEPAWSSAASPSPTNNSLLDPRWRTGLPPTRPLLTHNHLAMDRELYRPYDYRPYPGTSARK